MPRTAGSRNCILRIILAAILLWPGSSHAIDIVVSGSWSLTVGSADLAASAGTNLPNSFDSDVSQAFITISNTTGDMDNWRVDVRRSDVLWPAGLTLSVKRTSDGIGGGLILGGNAYQPVTTSDAEFFSGSGDRNGINVQLQISGTSIDVPPDTYSTSVVYTVVDTS